MPELEFQPCVCVTDMEYENEASKGREQSESDDDEHCLLIVHFYF